MLPILLTVKENLEIGEKGYFYQKIFFKYIFAIYSFIDVYYELRSYERGVAQLGSAGALGA